MQTFAVRGSDCRHILFTAPVGCLQGKLNPFPPSSSTGVCFVLVCKERWASFPLKQHHTIKVHTSRMTSKRGITFRVLALSVDTSGTTSPTSSNICRIKNFILYCEANAFRLVATTRSCCMSVLVPFIAHTSWTPKFLVEFSWKKTNLEITHTRSLSLTVSLSLSLSHWNV